METNDSPEDDSRQSANSSSSQLNFPSSIKSLNCWPQSPVDHSPSFSMATVSTLSDSEFLYILICGSISTSSKNKLLGWGSPLTFNGTKKVRSRLGVRARGKQNLLHEVVVQVEDQLVDHGFHKGDFSLLQLDTHGSGKFLNLRKILE